jgi:hypothetical protein
LVCEREDLVRVRVLPMSAMVLNLMAGGVGGLGGGLRDGESSGAVAEGEAGSVDSVERDSKAVPSGLWSA